ncbi:hypothetical protein GCM10025795_04160 [Verticiella sediminum]
MLEAHAGAGYARRLRVPLRTVTARMVANLKSIGDRLRAYRIGAGLSAEELGQRLNMSRASVYRIESNGIDRIDVLERIARLLDISVETLLGVGVEYVPSAVAYFERIRQIEAETDHVFVAFGPIVYLLTSSAYDQALRRVLTAQLAVPAHGARSVDELLGILARRKAQHRARPVSITNLLSVPDLLRFAERGLASAESSRAELAAQREMAQAELAIIARLFEAPPMGVQIGLVFDELPASGFTIFRRRAGSVVTTSPFRLGCQPNVWRGVAMISMAPDAVELHTAWAQEVWSEALTGQAAAHYIRRKILQPSS